MNKIYLVNVGANLGDRQRARSPIFPDGTFTFVSFPTDDGTRYPAVMRPYTRNVSDTHLDPDWQNLTYGDCVANARASALKRADRDDVLLFWGLLFGNSGADWSGFSGGSSRGWYLFGAMRIGWIMEAGQHLGDVPEHYRDGARKNAHVFSGKVRTDDRVFIANLKRSTLFNRAVDLGAHSPDGLMFRGFTTAQGEPILHGAKPHWSSTLRSCRCMFDLKTRDGVKRAQLVREAILKHNNFDLL